MQSLKFVIVLITLVVVLQAEKGKDKHHEIFKKCADANGLKMDPEQMKARHEAKKKGEKPPAQQGEMSKEMLCTIKCVWQEKGLLSGTDINIDKVKSDEMLKRKVKKENVEDFLKCIKPIKIKECSDMKKIMACKKA